MFGLKKKQKENVFKYHILKNFKTVFCLTQGCRFCNDPEVTQEFLFTDKGMESPYVGPVNPSFFSDLLHKKYKLSYKEQKIKAMVEDARRAPDLKFDFIYLRFNERFQNTLMLWEQLCSPSSKVRKIGRSFMRSLAKGNIQFYPNPELPYNVSIERAIGTPEGYFLPIPHKTDIPYTEAWKNCENYSDIKQDPTDGTAIVVLNDYYYDKAVYIVRLIDKETKEQTIAYVLSGENIMNTLRGTYAGEKFSGKDSPQWEYNEDFPGIENAEVREDVLHAIRMTEKYLCQPKTGANNIASKWNYPFEDNHYDFSYEANLSESFYTSDDSCISFLQELTVHDGGKPQSSCTFEVRLKDDIRENGSFFSLVRYNDDLWMFEDNETGEQTVLGADGAYTVELIDNVLTKNDCGLSDEEKVRLVSFFNNFLEYRKVEHHYATMLYKEK